MSVSHDEKVGTKILPTIKLVKDIHCGKNIKLVDRIITRTPFEMLKVQQADMKFIELSVRLPPMRDMSCASDFVRNVMMQNRQSKRVNATSEAHLKHLSSILHYDLLLA